jgi:hypothetical protein
MFSTKLHATDFAGDGLGQFGDKLDDTRVFVGRGLVLDVGLNVLNQLLRRLVTLGEYDCGLDCKAAYRVGNASYSTFYYCGVRHTSILHFKRADAVAATLEYVVDSAHKPIVAVLVAVGYIAGVIACAIVGNYLRL